MRRLALLLASAAVSCAPDGFVEDPPQVEKADGPQSGRDVLTTALTLDVGALQGTATITVGPGTRNAALEVGGLDLHAVRGPGGALPFRRRESRVVVTLPPAGGEITVEYGFQRHQEQDGLLENGSSVVWPYFCGNLWPCDPSPADGTRFSLEVRGVPSGQRVILPQAIDFDAPPYQLAFAVGEFEEIPLGATDAGTRVSVFHLPAGRTDALKGTRHLVAAFDWLEKTLGPYAYGDRVGSVAVAWSGGALGGMEHHPLWHVATESMSDEVTHVHEAAHGWFGDAIRIRCWEDFVLSEGTVSYLAARALAATAGEVKGDEVWAEYRDTLAGVRRDARRRTGAQVHLPASDPAIAWPDSCGKVDILQGLFADAPYMKGAFFYRAVERAVGAPALDHVLSRFYSAHRGQAAGMQDLLDLLRSETGFDPSDLAQSWLRSDDTPRIPQ